tara:strand:+ start:10670 stop:12439 length:1770 start_codon:yes stop_codon:yes gene_type:complete
LTIAPQQAAAATGKILSAGLDRIANFAFRQAYQQAAAQGAEYGAENAPTIEQIKQAQEDGEPLEAPGDMTTVFGRAARAQGLSTMRLNVEAAGRTELAQMHAKVINSEVPIDQYASQMNDVIKGLGDAVAQASPGTAAAVRASLATVASMQYKVHATGLAKKAEARRTIMVNEAISQVIADAVTFVKGGDQFEDASEPGDQVVTTSEASITSQRNMILKLALSIGDARLAKSALTQFNTAVQAARVGVVADYVENPNGTVNIQRYNAVLSGELSGTRIEGLHRSMNDEQRAATLKEVVRRGQEAYTLEMAADVRAERQRTIDVRSANIDFMDAWGKGGPEGMSNMQAARDRLRLMGADADYERTGQLMRGGVPTSSGATLYELNKKLTQFTLSRRDVTDQFIGGKLSYNDAGAYFVKIVAANDSATRESVTRYRTSLQLQPSMINPSSADKVKQNKVNSLHSKLIAEKQRVRITGELYDPMKIVNDTITADANKTMSLKEINFMKQTIYANLKRTGALGLSEKLPQSKVLESMDTIGGLQALQSSHLKVNGEKQSTTIVVLGDMLNELIEDLRKKQSLEKQRPTKGTPQ